MSGRVLSMWTLSMWAYMISSERNRIMICRASCHAVIGEAFLVKCIVFLKFSVKIFTLHVYQKSDLIRRHLIWKTANLLHVLL